MRIGIPRALFYHSYRIQFTAFFDALGVDIVLSPETNQAILSEGINLSIDECCLPVKIYMGHVKWLVSNCDCLFVPRIESYGQKDVACVKFFALHDIVANMFQTKVVGFNIDEVHGFTEEKAYIGLGKDLGFTRGESKRAYTLAKKAETQERENAELCAIKQLESEKLKILVVSHAYNIHDAFIGVPVISILKKLNTEVIIASELACEKYSDSAKEYTRGIYWKFNKELVGVVAQTAKSVDGIVLITAFPCGPDSLVNEVIIRKQKNVPLINLCIDELQGETGLETRIESFIDILGKRS